MVSCAPFILGPLWIHFLTQACRGDELPREAVLSWFRERVLEGLGLEEPPQSIAQGPDGDMAQPEVRRVPRRAPRTSRNTRANRRTSLNQETSQIILFPSSGERFYLFFFYFNNASNAKIGIISFSRPNRSNNLAVLSYYSCKRTIKPTRSCEK